jgi:Ras-related GTP-binding protein C/D
MSYGSYDESDDTYTYSSLTQAPLGLTDENEHSLTQKNVHTLLQASNKGADASSSTTNKSSSSSSKGGGSGGSKPRILLMGSRRSGKSSIAKVVFQKMSPHETLFIESTQSIRLRDIHTSALVSFQLLDFPGGFELIDPKSSSSSNQASSAQSTSGSAGGASGSAGVQSTSGGSIPNPATSGISSGISPELIFASGSKCSLVYVIDAQDDENQFTESIDYFIHEVKIARRYNPSIHVEVLIHKVDGDAYLSEDHKIDIQNEIKRSIAEELGEAGLSSVRPSYHLTSIYDHTIFEAFSKIVQTLLPSVGFLEKLLDGLVASCQMEKAFLFDVVSKIYVATDSNPVDMQTYELCSDMIDVVIDVSCIYGLPAVKAKEAQKQQQAQAQQSTRQLEKLDRTPSGKLCNTTVHIFACHGVVSEYIISGDLR